MQPEFDFLLLTQLSVAGTIGTVAGQQVSQILPQSYLPKLIAGLLMGISLLSLGTSSWVNTLFN